MPVDLTSRSIVTFAQWLTGSGGPHDRRPYSTSQRGLGVERARSATSIETEATAIAARNETNQHLTLAPPKRPPPEPPPPPPPLRELPNAPGGPGPGRPAEASRR